MISRAWLSKAADTLSSGHHSGVSSQSAQKPTLQRRIGGGAEVWGLAIISPAPA